MSSRTLACSVAAVAILLAISRARALTPDEENTIDVYRKVAPSVVNITTTSVDRGFFLSPTPSSGTGSGIVLQDNGLIVTNHHVVADARRIEVTLADGTHWEAVLVGSAPERDLAVIAIEAEGHSLTAMALGDSEALEVGQKVLAIGNPFGLGQTLTTGTVSMLGRTIRTDDGRVLRNMIQTDASINPGNSGGALVDSRGKLVGVNAAIFSTTGSSIGIGLAIPVNEVKRVVPGLTSPWGRWLGWALAALVLGWMLRRIYR